MTIQSHDVYRSPNGDRWVLIWDSEDRQGIVRHEPSRASGGGTTETPVREFLDRTGDRPENQALRALLKRLD